MIIWVALILATVFGSGTSAECFYPENPVLESVDLVDAEAFITPGTLHYAGRSITRCSGLPGSHPMSLSPWRDGVAIGFRDEGLYSFDGTSFRKIDDAPAGSIRALESLGDTLWIAPAGGGLWMLTETGVERYAPLEKRRVTALSRDSHGQLHIGTDPYGWWVVDTRGDLERRKRRVLVGCFASKKGKVRPVAPGPDCQRAPRRTGTRMPSAHVTALASTNRDLYIGFFDSGVWRKTATGFAPVSGSPRFINQLVVADGRLYAASAKGLYRTSSDGRMTRVPVELDSQHINGVHVSDSGRLWIATSKGLVSSHDGRTRVLSVAQGLPSRIVTAVTETNDGAIWAGTPEGLVRFYGGKVETFTHAAGVLPSDWVTALLPVGDSVAVGTYDAGVVIVDARGGSKPVEAFARAWINPNGLTRIDGHLAAATLGDGLIVASDQAGVRVSDLPATDVTAVVPHAGATWVATRSGLARFAPYPGWATFGE